MTIEFTSEKDAVPRILDIVAEEGFLLRDIRTIPNSSESSILKLDLANLGHGTSFTRLCEKLRHLEGAHSVNSVPAGAFRS